MNKSKLIGAYVVDVQALKKQAIEDLERVKYKIHDMLLLPVRSEMRAEYKMYKQQYTDIVYRVITQDLLIDDNVFQHVIELYYYLHEVEERIEVMLSGK